MKKLVLTALLAYCAQANAQNLIDNYLTGTPTYSTIASSTNSVSQPRDLDFKPHTKELWIINKGNTNGGSNVIIYNAGETNQRAEYRMDTHSGHFMIYPSSIAFGSESRFANTNEIRNTASPSSTFMGPALWTADTSIFARVFQNNWVNGKPLGSHLDMLHQSPFSMGIAHDTDNVYWVFDGHNGNLCKYDFGVDHSPGYDDHSNGKVWRYSDVTLTRQADVPGHMIKDKATGWLYIVDAGTKKLKRVNTATGTNVGSLNVPASGAEPLVGYWNVTGATMQVLDSFNTSQPCGIDLYNGRLIVGDFANGNIHVYNVTGATPVKMGTIATGQAGIMGLKIGEDGKIWFVNQTANTVVRMNPATGVTNDVAIDAITSPKLNNFDNNFYNTAFNQCGTSIIPTVTIKNNGTNTLTTATIQFNLDNGTNSTYAWSGSLAAGATASVTLPAINASNGAHKLFVEATNPNGAADNNMANNKKMGSFRALNATQAYPFVESFSGTTFPPANWTYLTHNMFSHMSRVAVNGGSVMMDNFSGVDNIDGQKDYLITPRINMTSAASNASLTFKVAYARYDNTSADALGVMVSTDCGETWASIYGKSGAALSTASNTANAYLNPAAGDWRTEVVSLSAYATKPDVIFQFVTTSNFGNNVYIDDININSGTTGVPGTQHPQFNIYPNPAKDLVTVEGINSNNATTISVFDIVGKMVRTVTLNQQSVKHTIDLSDQSTGTYIIKIKSGDYTHQQKITLVK